MGTDREGGRQFLEELERHHEPTLAAIRDHPCVISVAEEMCTMGDLRRFALAEYLYMRGGVKHFTLSVLNSPDLNSSEWRQRPPGVWWQREKRT